VLGDATYGHARTNKRRGAKAGGADGAASGGASMRPFLHAWRLELAHPVTGTPLAFEACAERARAIESSGRAAAYGMPA
jgi:23S rRNA-/tRNA-specific pseudouridylate synthase